MRLGVHLVSFTLPGGSAAIAPTLAAVGSAAEEAGLDNLSFMDHHLQLEFLGDPTEPMLEGYTALGFLAAHTSTVELQLLMTGVTYRHPGILAKTVATLDQRIAAGAGPDVVRLSVGIEDVGDIIADLEQALETI